MTAMYRFLFMQSGFTGSTCRACPLIFQLTKWGHWASPTFDEATVVSKYHEASFGYVAGKLKGRVLPPCNICFVCLLR